MFGSRENTTHSLLSTVQWPFFRRKRHCGRNAGGRTLLGRRPHDITRRLQILICQILRQQHGRRQITTTKSMAHCRDCHHQPWPSIL